MKNVKKKLLVALTSLALAPLAQANVISFSDMHDSSVTDWFDTLTVSQFDTNLGTLNSVAVTFQASMLSDIILDNDNISATTARGTTNVETIGSFLGLGDLGINLSANTGFQSLGADDSGNADAPLDGGADEFASEGLSDNSFISVLLDASHADFSRFIGTGVISTIGLGTFGGYSVLGGGGNVDASVSTFAGANLTVDYNYTVAPTGPVGVSEPGSMAILALGLAGVAVRRKKKAL